MKKYTISALVAATLLITACGGAVPDQKPADTTPATATDTAHSDHDHGHDHDHSGHSH